MWSLLCLTPQMGVAMDSLQGIAAQVRDIIHDVVKGLAPMPMWYTSHNYPHGPKAFRRHIRCGMKAIRVGKGYAVKHTDAERFWETLPKRASKPDAPGEWTPQKCLAASGLTTTMRCPTR